MNFRSIALALASACMAAGAVSARAEEPAARYPSRPIKIIVTFTAGGVVDTVGRIIGERLSARYGQPVVVENRAGAGGSIGTGTVAKADPDGYTLLVVSTYYAVVPSLVKGVGWSARDFKAIEGIGYIPNVLVVSASSQATSLQDFLVRARNAKVPVTYASPGVGTSNHLTGELLAQRTGLPFVHVPYKGQSDALSDVLAGRVELMPLTSALATEYVKAGKLKALAVTTSTRSGSLPDVPTVEEASQIKPFDVRSWFGFVAPGKTPTPIVQKLARDIADIMNDRGTQDKLKAAGIQIELQGPEEFGKYIQAETVRWKEVIEKSGITPQ